MPSNYTAARAVRLPLLPRREIAAEAQISLRQYDYAPLLKEYGYDGIIDAAYMESKAARPGHPFFKSPGAAIATLDYWIDECGPLLADVPLAILESLLDGTLVHKVSVPAVEHQDVAKYFDDSKLTQWVNAQASNGFKPDVSHWVTRMQKSYCPALYVRIFVDRNGQSPTLAQLRNVLDHLEK
ncbi:hypothetical protein N0V95_006017 [Ascochyta clinopodiicola]|nr:hypothetical protein N0V95_006017 [Ascochyta clinopodiicola]